MLGKWAVASYVGMAVYILKYNKTDQIKPSLSLVSSNKYVGEEWVAKTGNQAFLVGGDYVI